MFLPVESGMYLAITLFAISSTITPGPNNIMIMTSGLNFGIKKSLPHFFGICLGFPVMVILVGLGFSLLFTKYPLFHETIKIAGVLYLIYLAWLVAHSAEASSVNKPAKPLSFINAALFQWVNPKAWVMATGAISAYTSAASDIAIQVISIAVIFCLMAFPCVGTWMVFGAGLRKYLHDPKHQKAFNITMASLLIMSIIPVINELITEYFF